jgi:MurNAc alpha-1-phosphate uridylyltransferase
MIAIILAAGLGTRLAPLTHYRPKPLINFQGQALISHHILNLLNIGIKEIHINTSHADLFEKYIKEAHPHAPIIITQEPYLQPYGTLEGLIHIKEKHQLTGPLLVISADVFTPLSPEMLLTPKNDGHLFLINGPHSDFNIQKNRIINGSFTYSNIGVFQSESLKASKNFKSHILENHFTGSILNQTWLNVGDFKTLI